MNLILILRQKCLIYIFRESSIELNPIGNMEVKTAHVRSSAIPTVNLKKRDWYPNATNFDSKIFSVYIS